MHSISFVRVFEERFWTVVPSHALHVRKGFTETNRRRSTGQQPGTKSASRPGDKPLINPLSTAGFVPPPVNTGFSLFVLPRRFPDMPCMRKKLPRHTSTKRRRSTRQQPGTKSASRPVDKPRINRGSTTRFVPSCGLDRISLVRASEEMFRTVVFDVLEDTRDGCVLRRETRRRPILPGPPCPAAPLCAARPDPPVVCPGFGFDKYLTETIVSRTCLA